MPGTSGWLVAAAPCVRRLLLFILGKRDRRGTTQPSTAELGPPISWNAGWATRSLLEET
jgi:hypothetical protein